MAQNDKLFYMLIGLPGVGKTTYRRDMIHNHPFRRWKVVSIDDLVEAEAEAKGLQYDEIWKDLVGGAADEALQIARQAYEGGYDVIWDATNLTRKSRSEKLASVPPGYVKYAVVIDPPEPKEYVRRLSSRPGKFIHPDIIADMRRRYEEPSEEEGFRYVVHNVVNDGRILSGNKVAI